MQSKTALDFLLASAKNCKNDTIFGNLRTIIQERKKETTTIHKILETNPSFYVKQRTTGKAQFFFTSFLLILPKFSFWEED